MDKKDRLNQALGIFLPTIARRLWNYRHGQRKYAAAKTGVSIGNWMPADSGVNDEIGSSKAVINMRVRQLVRDMPHASVALDRLVDYTVGDGMKLQARVTNDDGSLNKEVNKQIEDAWKFWCDEADVSGKLHFNELQRLAKRQDGEIGEFLFMRRQTRKRGQFLPYSLQVFEGDAISELTTSGTGNNEVYYGVEYNTSTVEPKAYHMETGRYGQTNRVNASQLIHGFRTLRPNQLRGVSAFAPAILLAHSLRDYTEAEMDAAQMAAKWLGFVYVPDVTSAQASFGASYDSDFSRITQDIGNATLEYLKPGEEIKFASHNRGASFDPFTKFVLRTFAAVVGMPYEIVTGDFSGTNYTTLRGVKNELKKTLRPQQQRHIQQFCRPVYYDFLDNAVLSGRLSLPRYFSDPWRYRKAVWIDPGMEAVDPLREGKADIEAVDSLLKSPQEIITARGRDPDEVLAEIAQFNADAEALGLETKEVSLAAQTAPSALEDEEDEDAET